MISTTTNVRGGLELLNLRVVKLRIMNRVIANCILKTPGPWKAPIFPRVAEL
jgi:hypothetical protein